MAPQILGLHHVTATVNDSQADLDFCHDVYHFYYGTERGAPGTIWTTFPYKGYGVPVGDKGAGQVVTTAFSVPAASMPFWRKRLGDAGVKVRDIDPRFGEEVIRFDDPSGLWFELLGSGRDERAPWSGGGIEPDAAIRGLHGVTLLVRQAAPTLALLTEVLGYTVVGEAANRTRVAAGGDAPGHFMDVVEDPEADRATNGLGTVHHVAMAIGTDAEQLQVREQLVELGLRVTEVRDRCYFHSIYFREPGGVLFEVATIQPGFTVDEDLSELGRNLKLPYWEEPYRESIETNLAPVEYR
jgi:glyoxalase family protein